MPEQSFSPIAEAEREAEAFINYRRNYLSSVLHQHHFLDCFTDSKYTSIEDCMPLRSQAGMFALLQDIAEANQSKRVEIRLRLNQSLKFLDQLDLKVDVDGLNGDHSDSVSLISQPYPQTITEKAIIYYSKGRILNAYLEGGSDEDCSEASSPGVDFSPISPDAAEYWLTKALRLQPQLSGAWCELGEAAWRLGDAVSAVNHFKNALKYNPNHVKSLCQLSMALRQLSSSQGPSNPEVATAITDKDQLNSVTINNSTSCAVSSSKPEHKYASELCDEKPFSSDFKTPEDSNTSSKIATASLPPLLESLNLARRAVQQSPTDGTAWSTLGNALFSYFFSTSLGPRVRITSCPTAGTELRQCLAAYAQGARDLRTALEPNFHYNRGVACHYQDNFDRALRSWLLASCLDPGWTAPRHAASRLASSLVKTRRLLIELQPSVACSDERVETATAHPIESGAKLGEGRGIKKHGRLAKDLTPGLMTACLDLLTAVRAAAVSLERDNMALEPRVDSSALSRLFGPYLGAVLKGTMAAAKVQLSSCSLDSQSNKSISTQPSRQHDQRRVLAGGRQHRGSTRPALKTGTRKSLATLLQSLDLNSLPHLQLMSFTQLQDGPNHGCICVGRVLATLPADSDLALPLLLVDPWGSVLPFRIFAIGQGLGPSVKDILAIPDPYIANVSVPHRVIKAVFRLSRLLDGDDEIGNHGDVDDSDNDDGGSSESSLFLPPASSESAESADSALKKMKASGRPDFHWRLIRIASPDVLVVNSRSVGRAWNAPVCLRNIFFTAG